MTPQQTEKVTLVLPLHHNWLKGLRGSSLILEYLLNKEFGIEVGAGDDADRIAAEKIVKAQKIMEEMRAKKQKHRDDPDDNKDKRT